jgi:RNA polymerase sigma-70 factor (ECF subfamily)
MDNYSLCSMGLGVILALHNMVISHLLTFPFHLTTLGVAMDYTRLNDETLLRLIASSQENALGELYDRYSRLVYSVALNALSDPGRAEEVTQDVFVRVWEKAHTFNSEHGRVATWLTSIARHRSIDLYRQSSTRHENLVVTWEEAESFDLPNGQNVEWEVDLAQRQQRIRQAMAQLPDEQKQALGMAFFQGLSHPEIAAALGEPLGTVKTRIRLGMGKLRHLLQDER